MDNNTLILIGLGIAVWYFGFGPGKLTDNPRANSPTIIQRDVGAPALTRTVFPKPGEIVQYTSGSKVMYTGEGGVA